MTGPTSSPATPAPDLTPTDVVSGRIKPNNANAPSIGNTTGIIVPKTTPNGATGGPITTLPTDPPIKPETPKEQSWWRSWGGVVHTGLDVAGAIPVVGIFADGANALIYTAEGNYVQAGISGASAAANLIPGGGAVMKGGKLAVKVGEKVIAKQGSEMAAKELAKRVEKEAAEAVAKGAARKAEKEAAEAAAKKQAQHTAQHTAQSSKNNGGKSERKQRARKRKPKKCCPQNTGPKNISAETPKPVHLGTGEEILHHHDFSAIGLVSIDWTRCYRSSNNTYDDGLLGARWITPYTTSIVEHQNALVYIDADGRDVHLPAVPLGATHDDGFEGFVLGHPADGTYTLTYRDGSSDTFIRSVHQTNFHVLVRQQQRDGKALTIEHLPNAPPGEAMLRITDGAGLMVEGIRASFPTDGTTHPPSGQIERIEQVFTDGRRFCHVRYVYLTSAGRNDVQDVRATCDLVAAIDALDHKRQYAYAHHLLTHMSNANSNVFLLEWQSVDALYTDQPGVITAANSHLARCIGTHADDGSGALRIAYLDPDTTQLTDALGVVSLYTFNDDNLITSVEVYAPDIDREQQSANASTGRRTWDTNGNLLADIDADGNTSRYTYDKNGNLLTSINAEGATTRIEYDTHNRPVNIIDAHGHAANRRYDARGNLTSQTDALGQTSRYEYDEANNLVAVIDAKGGKKTLKYNQVGQLTRYTDCSDQSTQYDYDRHGRLLSITDAQGNVTQYEPDAKGNVRTIIHPDRRTESMTYDGEGNLLSHTDADGHVTRYRYDHHNQLIHREDAKGQVFAYRYNAALQLIALINQNGETCSFAYDKNGQLISETGFDGKVSTYRYDRAGQLIASAVDGKETAYMRDAVGRLVARQTGQGLVRYEYDLLGQLLAVQAPDAQQRFVYDQLGQLIEERQQVTLQRARLPFEERTPDVAFVLRHQYDALGNRTHTTLPHGRTVTTQRYGSGHWHGTLWQSAAIVDLERDAMHRETSRSLGRGSTRLQQTRAYDPQSRLTAISLSMHQQTLARRAMRYDAVGQLTQIRDLHREKIDYHYDPVGQLLAAVQPGLNERFAFDPAGNLLDEQPESDIPLSASDLASTAPTMNAPILDAPLTRPDETRALTDQGRPIIRPANLPKVTHNLLRTVLGIEYDYDADGNTIRKIARQAASANDAPQQLELRYDVENRLVKAIKVFPHARQVTEYFYDAFSRRVAKRITDEQYGPHQKVGYDQPLDKAQATTYFVWDGNTLAQEITSHGTISYLYEPETFVPLAKIASTTPVDFYAPLLFTLNQIESWKLPERVDPEHEPTLRLDAHYQPKTRQREKDALAAEADNAGHDRVWLYHNDHLGTPQELVSEDGKIVWQAKYKAWGRVYALDVSHVAQPLRFQGQYEDEETGLYYNRFRYYDPDTARYLSQDPIGLEGGANLYAYVLNPIGWVDPLGLAGHKCIDGAAREALNRANPKSIAKNKEYGGLIYKLGNKYYATMPMQGTATGFKPTVAKKFLPPGARVVGDYHTHGDYSMKGTGGKLVRTDDPSMDSRNSDNFSAADKKGHMMASMENKCHRSYLGTPSGKFKVMQGGEVSDF